MSFIQSVHYQRFYCISQSLDIIQWNLVNMNSRNVHIIRNFTLTVASCVSVIMPGDFKVVCIKQVSHFNSVHINKVPL